MHLPTRKLFAALALTMLSGVPAHPAGPMAAAAGEESGGATPTTPVPAETAVTGVAPAVRLAPLRVTADLWDTPLARIPASVTVIDAEALEGGAVRHFGDWVDQIPNLTWTGAASRPRHLQIRGLGENSQYEGETPDSAVRFLVDDLDFTGLGGVGSTFDVRQMEVVRGPQAGAYGANAAGGVVRLVTNAPTPYWTGQAEATVGGDALRTAGVAVGGPLLGGRPDELMVRLAVQHSRSDGFRHNATLDRATNARDEALARLRLTWNPGGRWRWEAAVLAANLDNGFDAFALDNNGRTTFSDQPGRDEQRSLAASLRGTWSDGGGWRLTSVTGGTRTRTRYSYDDDWTAASYEGFSDLRRTRAVASQELRLDSVPGNAGPGAGSRWTLGAYLATTDETSGYTNTDPGNLRGLRTEYRARNTALFAQWGHEITPGTRLVAGLRVERFDLTGAGTKTRYRRGPGTFDPEVVVRPAFGDTLAGGKLALEHELGAHGLAYVSFTHGYKAGGVNLDARLDPAADPLTYATETLGSAEAGLRGQGWAGRLTGELTVFEMRRRAAQVRDSAGFGGTYRFFTDNAGAARIRGLEAAAGWAPTRSWTVRGTLALMRSTLDPFRLHNGNAGGGRELANAPHFGYMLGTRVGADRGLFAQAELVGRARQYDSNTQNEARRAFQVVNASAGYAGRRWTLTLWAKNLLDATYDQRVFYFGNAEPDYPETRYEDRAAPRQLGVSLSCRF